jgi:hypothetical protein
MRPALTPPKVGPLAALAPDAPRSPWLGNREAERQWIGSSASS